MIFLTHEILTIPTFLFICKNKNYVNLWQHLDETILWSISKERNLAKSLQNLSDSIANLIWFPNWVCRHILHDRAVALINAKLLYVEVTHKFQKGTKLKCSDVCHIMKLVKGIQWVERVWEIILVDQEYIYVLNTLHLYWIIWFVV